MILKIIKFFLAMAFFLNISIALAADIHHYEVKVSPEKVSIGEAVDLTIEAVDKDNNIIKDYEGTVLIFSESDKKAEFPKIIEDSSYEFKKSDEGIVKFENAVKFTKVGKNDIHVYDLGDQTDSVLGLTEVEVSEEKIQEKIDIEIITPESNTTIGKENINISGKSKKNHQIKIIVNNKEEILTTTNKDGIFEKEVEGLENGENVIKAFILNSDGDEIGKSNEVLIKLDSTIPVFNKIKITPNGEIDTNSNILAEVYASKGLSEVKIIINEGINILKEDTEGLYKGEFLSPKNEGDYKIDLVLKNELGTKLEEKGVETLNVIPKLTTAPIKKIVDKKIIEKKNKDKCTNGDYSGDVYDGICGEKPKDYKSPVDLGIRNLRIVQLKTKSVLTWDNLEDATKYEIYKKMTGGKLELIETVTNPKYEIAITGDDIKYEYFAVKAIGKQEFFDINDKTKKIEKEIVGDLSDAIKIQTGPKEIIIVLLALLLGFGIFFIGRRKA